MDEVTIPHFQIIKSIFEPRVDNTLPKEIGELNLPSVITFRQSKLFFTNNL